MKLIVAHDHYDEAHLDAVTEEMKSLGAPTIKAIYLPAYDAWMALEGCHRIRAAHALGIEPVIDEQEWDGDKMASDYGTEWEDDCSIDRLTDDAHRREIFEF